MLITRFHASLLLAQFCKTKERHLQQQQQHLILNYKQTNPAFLRMNIKRKQIFSKSIVLEAKRWGKKAIKMLRGTHFLQCRASMGGGMNLICVSKNDNMSISLFYNIERRLRVINNVDSSFDKRATDLDKPGASMKNNWLGCSREYSVWRHGKIFIHSWSAGITANLVREC